MNNIIKIKNSLIIISFTFYLFLWSVEFNNSFNLRYFILIPFLLSFLELKNLINFNFKNFLIFSFILVSHFFLVNIFNSTGLLLRDFVGLVFFLIIIFTYYCYRGFIIKNFKYILYLFFSLLLIFSIIKDQVIYIGSCNQDFYIYFKDILSNGLFRENSHFAMVNIGAVFYSFYYYIKNKNLILLILSIAALLVNFINASTTFLAGLIVSSFVLLFFYKNITFRIILIISLISSIYLVHVNKHCSKKILGIKANDIVKQNLKRNYSQGYEKLGNTIEFTDNYLDTDKNFTGLNFSKKYAKKLFEGGYKNLKDLAKAEASELSGNDKLNMSKEDAEELIRLSKLYLQEHKDLISKKPKNIIYKDYENLTSAIYERSFIVSLHTLKNNFFGWGYDGHHKALQNFLEIKEKENLYYDKIVFNLNKRDALGNIFKIIIEYGLLSLLGFYFAIKYIRNTNFDEFQIFVITIFVIQLCRGAGYINGGFALCFAELIFINFLNLSKKV